MIMCPRCKKKKAQIISERGEDYLFCNNCGWIPEEKEKEK